MLNPCVVERIQFTGEVGARLRNKRERMTIEEAERTGAYADALTLHDIAVGQSLDAMHNSTGNQE